MAGAGSQLESPACVAVISQTPEARNVTTPLLILQTLPRPFVREMIAARPEVADAVGE